jgi:hypothetical protein
MLLQLLEEGQTGAAEVLFSWSPGSAGEGQGTDEVEAVGRVKRACT